MNILNLRLTERGYKVDQPGNQSGEYVKADISKAMLEQLELISDLMSDSIEDGDYILLSRAKIMAIREVIARAKGGECG